LWKGFSWIQSKKRNRFEQERASRLAHVHWSLRFQARLSFPRYEEMILPDVTENPMYSTDDAWDGAVTDELDDFFGASSYAYEPAASLLHIATLEEPMTASPGDWIIRGIKGEFYPCKEEIFLTTYHPVEG
jgi:hypothetical protein